MRGGGTSSATCSSRAIPEIAEAIAGELLARSRMGPGSSMVRVALALGYEVAARQLPDGIAGASARGCRWIFVAPSGYRPRDEFTIAHELMELHIPRSVLELPRATKERFCDRGAAALLLPRGAFLRSLTQHGWEIEQQRQRWPLVSGRVIEARIYECAAP